MSTASSITPQTIPLPNADLVFYENIISPELATLWFDALNKGLNWQQESLVVYGKEHAIPRLQCFYGDEGVKYQYSGKVFNAQLWDDNLRQLKQLVESICQVKFNCVLANLYRDGNDCMGWHADDEAELGKTPVIASLSFGATRCFKLKHRLSNEKFEIELTSGSLLIMAGSTQEFWYHSLPKRARVNSARVNLTFRYMKSLF